MIGTTVAAAAALLTSATISPATSDPSGSWLISANGKCFGSAAYADGDDPLVGTDFACSRKLAKFSPPSTGSITVSFNSLRHAVTLSGGPSRLARQIVLDADGFGVSGESYRNETGPLEEGCSVHSFFTEVVQFSEGHLSYAYVDNSEFIPDQETVADANSDGMGDVAQDTDGNAAGSVPLTSSSCDLAIARLRNAVANGKASPGTEALVESGAIDMHRLPLLRQTSIYYLYDGKRSPPKIIE